MFGFSCITSLKTCYHFITGPALLYRDRVEFTTDEGVGNLW